MENIFKSSGLLNGYKNYIINHFLPKTNYVANVYENVIGEYHMSIYLIEFGLSVPCTPDNFVEKCKEYKDYQTIYFTDDIHKSLLYASSSNKELLNIFVDVIPGTEYCGEYTISMKARFGTRISRTSILVSILCGMDKKTSSNLPSYYSLEEYFGFPVEVNQDEIIVKATEKEIRVLIQIFGKDITYEGNTCVIKADKNSQNVSMSYLILWYLKHIEAI